MATESEAQTSPLISMEQRLSATPPSPNRIADNQILELEGQVGELAHAMTSVEQQISSISALQDRSSSDISDIRASMASILQALQLNVQTTKSTQDAPLDATASTPSAETEQVTPLNTPTLMPSAKTAQDAPLDVPTLTTSTRPTQESALDRARNAFVADQVRLLYGERGPGANAAVGARAFWASAHTLSGPSARHWIRSQDRAPPFTLSSEMLNAYTVTQWLNAVAPILQVEGYVNLRQFISAEVLSAMDGEALLRPHHLPKYFKRPDYIDRNHPVDVVLRLHLLMRRSDTIGFCEEVRKSFSAARLQQEPYTSFITFDSYVASILRNLDSLCLVFEFLSLNEAHTIAPTVYDRVHTVLDSDFLINVAMSPTCLELVIEWLHGPLAARLPAFFLERAYHVLVDAFPDLTLPNFSGVMPQFPKPSSFFGLVDSVVHLCNHLLRLSVGFGRVIMAIEGPAEGVRHAPRDYARRSAKTDTVYLRHADVAEEYDSTPDFDTDDTSFQAVPPMDSMAQLLDAMILHLCTDLELELVADEYMRRSLLSQPRLQYAQHHSGSHRSSRDMRPGPSSAVSAAVVPFRQVARSRPFDPARDFKQAPRVYARPTGKQLTLEQMQELPCWSMMNGLRSVCSVPGCQFNHDVDVVAREAVRRLSTKMRTPVMQHAIKQGYLSFSVDPKFDAAHIPDNARAVRPSGNVLHMTQSQEIDDPSDNFVPFDKLRYSLQASEKESVSAMVEEEYVAMALEHAPLRPPDTSTILTAQDLIEYWCLKLGTSAPNVVTVPVTLSSPVLGTAPILQLPMHLDPGANVSFLRTEVYDFMLHHGMQIIYRRSKVSLGAGTVYSDKQVYVRIRLSHNAFDIDIVSRMVVIDTEHFLCLMGLRYLI